MFIHLQTKTSKQVMLSILNLKRNRNWGWIATLKYAVHAQLQDWGNFSCLLAPILQRRTIYWLFCVHMYYITQHFSCIIHKPKLKVLVFCCLTSKVNFFSWVQQYEESNVKILIICWPIEPIESIAHSTSGDKWVWNVDGMMTGKGKPKFWKINMPSAALSTTNFTNTAVRLKLGFCCVKSHTAWATALSSHIKRLVLQNSFTAEWSNGRCVFKDPQTGTRERSFPIRFSWSFPARP